MFTRTLQKVILKWILCLVYQTLLWLFIKVFVTFENWDLTTSAPSRCFSVAKFLDGSYRTIAWVLNTLFSRYLGTVTVSRIVRVDVVLCVKYPGQNKTSCTFQKVLLNCSSKLCVHAVYQTLLWLIIKLFVTLFVTLFVHLHTFGSPQHDSTHFRGK